MLAAGGDYAADSAAILLAIIAVTIRERVGPASRATTYVAAANALALLAATVFVLVTAADRLLNGTPEVQGLPVLIVSSVATAVMVTGVFVLRADDGRDDLHMRSLLLDTASDALASAAVAVSGAVFYLTERFFWLDSALSLAIGLVIGTGALRLLGAVASSLRRGTDLDLD